MEDWLSRATGPALCAGPEEPLIRCACCRKLRREHTTAAWRARDEAADREGPICATCYDVLMMNLEEGLLTYVHTDLLW